MRLHAHPRGAYMPRVDGLALCARTPHTATLSARLHLDTYTDTSPQELLVCVEMVLVALLFHRAFPVDEFADVLEIKKARVIAKVALSRPPSCPCPLAP